MKRFSIALGLALLTALAPPATAQEAPGRVALGVDEAIARALDSNEDVLLAEADRRLAAGRLAEVESVLRPGVTFDLDYTRNIEQPVFFLQQGGQVQEIQVGSDHEYDLALTLEQPLFDARVFPALRANRLAVDAADAGVADRRIAIALAARLAYYEALLAAEQVEVQRQALAQAEDRLGQVDALFEAGTAAEFDVLTARVEVDNIRPDLIDAENRRRLSAQRLKRVVGLPPATEVELTADFVPLAPPPTLDEAVEEALTARGDLEALRLTAEAQEQRVQRERRSNLPSVRFLAELRRQASSDEALPDDLVQSSNAQVRVTVPLFQGGARKARVEQERAALDTNRLRLQQRVEDVRLEVQEALLALDGARQAIEASEANVERAGRALEIAGVRFVNGLSTQVELNDAELAVTRARSNFAAARWAYSVAWAR
ncbi:MAG TPA: TolC family protein, partial [Thermoanaerobaculia bacterium]|nr:TolC family protein [Thermoanaerobaculia bacterium]